MEWLQNKEFAHFSYNCSKIGQECGRETKRAA